MVRFIVTILVLALGAGVAFAEGMPPIGMRAGYTNWDNLDQFHFGAHVKVGDIFPNVALTPNIELGFGDDVTVVAVNGDVVYRFTELAQAPWGPYGGGSLSINYVEWNGFDETEIGLNLVAGTTYALDDGNEVLGEIRIGLEDSPDFKLTFGYTFF